MRVKGPLQFPMDASEYERERWGEAHEYEEEIRRGPMMSEQERLAAQFQARLVWTAPAPRKPPMHSQIRRHVEHLKRKNA